jgi:hypothetical protein
MLNFKKYMSLISIIQKVFIAALSDIYSNLNIYWQRNRKQELPPNTMQIRLNGNANIYIHS